MKQRKKKTVKEFIKQHKWEILALAIGAGLGFKIANRQPKVIDLDDNRLMLEALKSTNRPSIKANDWEAICRQVDEEIFTDLAPEMEDAILDKGIKEFWTDRVYRIAEDSTKVVNVNIKTIKD